MRALALVACTAALGLAMASCGAKKEDPPRAVPVASASAVHLDPTLVASGRVALGKVEKRVPRGERRVAGEVRADEKGRAEAGTLVAGRVAAIEVSIGAKVEKGAVLAWIDAPDLGRAVADVLRARARASVAAHKLERQLELEKENATSKNAVDDARAESLVAQADLAAARTALATIGGSEPSAGTSARLAVRAPMAGIVTRRDVVLGAHVSAEKTLFEIVAPAHVQIVANLPETVPAPPMGTSAQIHPRGSEAKCAAKVVGDVGVVDEATRTRSIRLEATEPCTLLVPGAFVDVVFPTELKDAKPALVVPREAVIEVHQAKVVFVTTDHGATFVARTVRTGAVVGADTIVEDGLREGEELAVVGAILLKGELLRSELE